MAGRTGRRRTAAPVWVRLLSGYSFISILQVCRCQLKTCKACRASRRHRGDPIARTRLGPRRACLLCATSGRAHRGPELRVERVADRVAEQVEPEHGEEDGEAGKRWIPPGIHHVAPRLRDERPPFR